MEKIDFINYQQPALNATNLNKLQQNVEDVTGDLSDLETSDRDNLVEAINEAKRSGGDAVPIHSIFDYDGDTVPTGYEEVEETEDYSTSETKTGKKWIDGRPIYRKVIATNLSVTNGTYINLSSLNINEILEVKSINKKVNNDFTFYDNFFDSSSEKITLHYRNDIIEFWTGSGANYTSTVWIEYTKTTDGGNS